MDVADIEIDEEMRELLGKMELAKCVERVEALPEWKNITLVINKYVELLKEQLLATPHGEAGKILEIQCLIRVWRTMFTQLKMIKAEGLQAEEEYDSIT